MDLKPKSDSVCCVDILDFLFRNVHRNGRERIDVKHQRRLIWLEIVGGRIARDAQKFRAVGGNPLIRIVEGENAGALPFPPVSRAGPLFGGLFPKRLLRLPGSQRKDPFDFKRLDQGPVRAVRDGTEERFVDFQAKRNRQKRFEGVQKLLVSGTLQPHDRGRTRTRFPDDSVVENQGKTRIDPVAQQASQRREQGQSLLQVELAKLLKGWFVLRTCPTVVRDRLGEILCDQRPFRMKQVLQTKRSDDVPGNASCRHFKDFRRKINHRLKRTN